MKTALKFALGLTAAFALAGGAEAKDKIVLGTNWYAQAEHGGYYYAKAYGLYDAADLDVEIRPGGAQVDTASLLIGGKLDFAMLGASFEPLNMVREKVPFVAVAAIFQKDPQMLMAHKELGLKSLADVNGRPVYISNGARESFWKFLQVKYGFKDEQIKPYAYNIGPFLINKDVIQQGYITNEPYRAKENGVDPDVFLFADYGYPSYAAILATSQKMVKEKPDVVRRFVDASLKGWTLYLSGERAKADALIMADNKDYTQKAADQSVAAMNAAQLATGGDAATLGIGAMTEARWKEFFDIMVKANVYKPDLDWKQAFTLDFVNKKVGMK